MERRPTIGARVDPEVEEALDRYTEQHGLDRSEAIRRLLREALDLEPAQRPLSEDVDELQERVDELDARVRSMENRPWWLPP